jgi:hypothetical protein
MEKFIQDGNLSQFLNKKNSHSKKAKKSDVRDYLQNAVGRNVVNYFSVTKVDDPTECIHQLQIAHRSNGKKITTDREEIILDKALPELKITFLLPSDQNLRDGFIFTSKNFEFNNTAKENNCYCNECDRFKRSQKFPIREEDKDIEYDVYKPFVESMFLKYCRILAVRAQHFSNLDKFDPTFLTETPKFKHNDIQYYKTKNNFCIKGYKKDYWVEYKMETDDYSKILFILEQYIQKQDSIVTDENKFNHYKNKFLPRQYEKYCADKVTVNIIYNI